MCLGGVKECLIEDIKLQEEKTTEYIKLYKKCRDTEGQKKKNSISPLTKSLKKYTTQSVQQLKYLENSKPSMEVAKITSFKVQKDNSKIPKFTSLNSGIRGIIEKVDENIDNSKLLDKTTNQMDSSTVEKAPRTITKQVETLPVIHPHKHSRSYSNRMQNNVPNKSSIIHPKFKLNQQFLNETENLVKIYSSLRYKTQTEMSNNIYYIYIYIYRM